MDQGAKMQWSSPIIYPTKAFQSLLDHSESLPQKQGMGTWKKQGTDATELLKYWSTFEARSWWDFNRKEVQEKKKKLG